MVRPIVVHKAPHTCAAHVASHDWFHFTTKGTFHSIMGMNVTTTSAMLSKYLNIKSTSMGIKSTIPIIAIEICSTTGSSPLDDVVLAVVNYFILTWMTTSLTMLGWHSSTIFLPGQVFDTAFK